MPSNSGRIRIRPQDVGRYRTAYVRAKNILEDARESLRSRSLDQMADRILPQLPDVGSDVGEWLSSNVLTRADYNRQLKYLERIAKASRVREPKDTRQASYFGTLTAVAYDEETGEYEGAFLRRERAMMESRKRSKVEKALERRGIKTMRVPVLAPDPNTGEMKRVYDRNRHLVTVTVPATPENRERYREAINKNQSLELPTPVVPEGAHVEVFGDMVPVKRAARHVASPESVMKGLSEDAMADMRTRGYFYNYGAIVDTTLPQQVSDEINEYVDIINDLSPAKRAEVYDYIESSPEDVGSIEYLYLDRSGSTFSKVSGVLKFWRYKVAPMIGAEIPKDAASASELETALESSGFKGGGAQTIYDEYQKAKQSGKDVSFTFEDIKEILRNAR